MGERGAAIRVLVVEDDEGNRLLLSNYLATRDFEVDTAVDGPTALRAATARLPDVVILDLGLPGLDGLDVLARLRRESAVPVLVLSGRDDEPTKLAGLDGGADDYMVKPFSLAELDARIRVLLRRGLPVAPRGPIVVKDLVVDVDAATASLGGTPLDLRPKELALLAYMASDPGRCFSREELLGHVWGSTAGWQQAATVTEHVHRLRGRLAATGDGHAWIETVRGLGYRLVPG